MPSEKRTVLLSIAGKTYRVSTSASEQHIRQLAIIVENHVRSASRGVSPGTDTMVLAAIALAHEASTQRTRAEQLVARTREFLQRLLGCIDQAVEGPPDSS